MSWKTAYRSMYYDGAPEPDDMVLPINETAFLVIDVQNTYLERPDPAALTAEEKRRYDARMLIHQRMHEKGHSPHHRNAHGFQEARGGMCFRPYCMPYR